MATDRVDAVVIFGATGDSAKPETSPALVGLVDRGVLDVPVVGVAKSGWGLEQFRDYAAASLRLTGIDPEGLPRLPGEHTKRRRGNAREQMRSTEPLAVRNFTQPISVRDRTTGVAERSFANLPHPTRPCRVASSNRGTAPPA
ncbi:hypothetical protein AB0F91_41585 [Amycolatopsis sp. NPDC023774]|uniref:hypothetical protein n=1 Tax=Amycolatopsis sp. NPDC023774 TaxID=3155015 RepID=UPI0033E95331